jgi:hypothetical protein
VSPFVQVQLCLTSGRDAQPRRPHEARYDRTPPQGGLAAQKQQRQAELTAVDTLNVRDAPRASAPSKEWFSQQQWTSRRISTAHSQFLTGPRRLQGSSAKQAAGTVTRSPHPLSLPAEQALQRVSIAVQ